MNRPTIGFAIVAAGAALTIAFLCREWRLARRAAGEREQARLVQAELHRQLSAAEERLREARSQTADLERALRIAEAHSAHPGAQADADPQAGADRRAAVAELHSRYMRAYRDNLDGQWGLLYQLLGLSQVQIEKLKDLLAQREENDITVEQTANRRGLDESSPEIQALDDELDRQNKAAIAALLGPQGYAQFRDYYHDRAVLPVVSDLAGDLFSTDSPLSAPQAHQLIGILADSSEKKEGSTVVKDTVNWDKAIAGAQAILSQPQVAALAALRSQYETDQQVDAYAKSLANTAGNTGP
jgi:hypothetical protein